MKIHDVPRMACTPQHASTYHCESMASVTDITFGGAFGILRLEDNFKELKRPPLQAAS
jgi:hypothetical protein